MSVSQSDIIVRCSIYLFNESFKIATIIHIEQIIHYKHYSAPQESY